MWSAESKADWSRSSGLFLLASVLSAYGTMARGVGNNGFRVSRRDSGVPSHLGLAAMPCKPARRGAKIDQTLEPKRLQEAQKIKIYIYICTGLCVCGHIYRKTLVLVKLHQSESQEPIILL